MSDYKTAEIFEPAEEMPNLSGKVIMVTGGESQANTELCCKVKFSIPVNGSLIIYMVSDSR